MKIEFIIIIFTVATVLSVTGCGGGGGSGSGSSSRVFCKAGCSTMSWGIEDESGGRNTEKRCTRDWVGSKYSEYCTGSVTYLNSGNIYDYTATFDWINCEIEVDVSEAGSCSAP